MSNASVQLHHICRTTIDDTLPSQAIGKLASSAYYVHTGTNIETLLELFNNTRDDIPAIAVADEEERARGAIIRKELVSLLGRPFGREVLKNRPVERVMQETRTFLHSRHIFSVSEELRPVLRSGKNEFFLLEDEHGRYRGIFSSRDLLVYLSTITDQDIALARNLQSRMVRDRLSVMTAELEVVASTTTAKGVGGDFYSLKKVTGKDWVISLCDVSGKGVAASIVTAMLYGIMETFDFRRGLRELVRELNRSVYSTFKAEKFLTGVFLRFDERKAKLTLLDMGHSYLSIIRGGKVYPLGSSGGNLPIGITEDLDPNIGGLSLQRGDIFVMFTDGLIEQRGPSGEEYREHALHDIILQYQHESLEEIRERVLHDFHTFKHDTPYHDDITFLLMRYPEEEELEEDIEWEREA